MSLTQQIAKNTTIQLVGKTISTILGLAAVAILTRSLGVEKFGWYITVTSFLQFFGLLSDFGFSVITANMLTEPQFDKSKLFNTLFTWRFITAGLTQIAALITILFFPYPTPIKIAAFIIFISFFTVSLNQIYLGYYQTQLKIIIQTTGEIIGRVVLVAGLALIALNKADFLPMIIIITLASVSYTFYLWLKGPKIRFTADKEISKIMFKKMWPLAVTIMFNAIYLQGDRLLLPIFTSQTNVGLYGAAYRVLDMVTLNAFLIIGIMLPLVTYAWSRNLVDEFKKHYQMSFDLMMLVVLPMIAGIIALANPIMKLIAGKEFASAGGILQILSIAIFGICFGMTFGNLATAINHQRQAMWVTISDAIISLVLYLIFIPRYGIWGAAGVTIFSEFYAGIGLLIVCSYYANYWPKLQTFLKIFFATILMALTVNWLQPLNIVLSVLIGATIYTCLILIFRTISRQTINEIFNR